MREFRVALKKSIKPFSGEALSHGSLELVNQGYGVFSNGPRSLVRLISVHENLDDADKEVQHQNEEDGYICYEKDGDPRSKKVWEIFYDVGPVALRGVDLQARVPEAIYGMVETTDSN